MITKTAEITVRGYHLDIFGFVNNARYLEFLEEGRWVFFDQSFNVKGWKDKGYAFFVVNININYRRAAALGEVLEVRTWVSKIGRTSAVAHQEIMLKGTETLIADADVTFVITDQETKRSVPIKGDLLEVFNSLAEPGKTTYAN